MVKSEECLGADFRYSGREVLSVAIHVLRLEIRGQERKHMHIKYLLWE